MILIALFSATVGVYAVKHGVHGFAAGHLSPTGAGFAALVPVLLYNYLGFDVPAAAAGEMRDPQRDLPAGILRAGVWTFVLYAVPVLSVLLVLPPERITGLTGFVAAIREVFTVYGAAGDALGTVAGALFVWALISSGATWLMASARSQAVACLDGAGPRRLGTFSKQGTPARLALVSGVVGSCVSVATFSIAGSSAERYFAVALSLSIAVIALSYVAIFAAPLRLRRTHPSVERPFRVPGGQRRPGDLQRPVAGLDGRRPGTAAVAAAPARGLPRRSRHVPADADRAARAAGRLRPRLRLGRPALRHRPPPRHQGVRFSGPPCSRTR